MRSFEPSKNIQSINIVRLEPSSKQCFNYLTPFRGVPFCSNINSLTLVAGHHEYTSVLPPTHTETGTSPGTTGSTKLTAAFFYTKLTTPSSCRDFPSSLYCRTYKNSCWNENIAYHCPHTCHVPGCPGNQLLP